MSDSFQEGTGTKGDSGDSDDRGASVWPRLGVLSGGRLAGIGNGAMLSRAATRSFAFPCTGADADIGGGVATTESVGFAAGVATTAFSGTEIAMRRIEGEAGGVATALATISVPFHGKSFPAKA
jgi:hypothetical protein